MDRLQEFELYLASFLPGLKTRLLNWVSASAGTILLLLNALEVVLLNDYLSPPWLIGYIICINLLTTYFQRLKDKADV